MQAPINPAAGPAGIYQQLSTEKREIRLLTIERASSTSLPLQCSIHKTSLNNCEKYLALSYTWGDENNTVPLELQGQTLHVTRNLESALRNISQMTKKLVIWADALCINQTDLSERVVQVRLMGDIYRNADHVFIWIGGTEEDGVLALDFIEMLGNAYCDLKSVDAAVDFINDPRVPQSLLDRSWTAVAQMLKRPWWTRIWTLQEAALAKEVSVICGTKSISLNPFYHTLLVLQTDAMTVPPKLKIRPDIKHAIVEAMYDPCVNARLSLWVDIIKETKAVELLELLSLCRVFAAKDARDKIYACIDLAKPIPGFNIDYVTPSHQVYTRFVVAYISHTKSLSILKEAGRDVSTQGSGNQLPSWVPDWTNADYRSRLKEELYHAAKDTEPRCSVLGNRLAVKGLLFERIETVELPRDRALVDWLRPALSGQSDVYDSMGIPQLQAYFRTFFTGQHPKTKGRLDPKDTSFFSPTISFCSFLSVDKEISSLLPQEIGAFATQSGMPLAQAILIFMLQQDDPDVTKAYWEWEAETHRDETRDMGLGHFSLKLGAANQWAFIMTSSGYMGLAPKWTQVDDQVCVLPGCCVPVVLRYAEGCYSLVGECFVLGLMDGEMLDGSDWEAQLRDFDIV
ncbi:heterokaryon incompatibility protein-domain-containing protein [Hyaloscypha sp. PMI_1271]|nr:heterokaryon incompatibility protein-domain-containing protein [Hyaloscypha sp. PMI_1271]